jgi:hypothetical protein
MANIHGPNEGLPPITPHDKQLYEAEYRRGVELFQRALDEYTKADEIHKKDAFREVMDRALQVLNETARELKRSDLMDQNKKISNDFQTYQDNQIDLAKNQLAQDLNQAKKSIG